MRIQQDVIGPYRRPSEAYQWGFYEICCSAMCLLLCLLLVGVFALGVLELMGLHSLTGLYGFMAAA